MIEARRERAAMTFLICCLAVVLAFLANLFVSPPPAGAVTCNLMQSGDDHRDWHYKRKCKTNSNAQAQQDTAKAASEGASAVPAGADDWLTPGTETYEKVKTAFDFLTGTKGLSGAAAIGILGASQKEGNFNEDIAEFGGPPYGVKYSSQAGIACVESQGDIGGYLHFGMDGDKPVCGMQYYTDRSMLGGGGIFQFTPFTKFTESPYFGKNGPGWSLTNQLEYVIDGTVMKRGLENACHTWGGQAPDLNGTFTTEEFLSTDDPEKAAQIFYACFLKGATWQPDRFSQAKQGNSVFNSSNISANESLWNIGGNSSSGGESSPTASSAQNKDDSANTQNCDTQCDPGAAKQIAPGGPAPESSGSIWINYEDIPDELKKDAVDFKKSFGLSKTTCDDTWHAAASTNPDLLDECVAFSKTAAYMMWSKDGQPLQPSLGDGGELADSYAQNHGVAVSKEPTRGAIASSHTCAGCTTHTWIVLQVYDDGSTLIAEQNNGKVGDSGGTTCDWSYRIYTKETAGSDAHYFDPSKAGYSLSLDGSGSAAAAAARGASSTSLAASSGSIGSASYQCTAEANSGAIVDGNLLSAAETVQGKPYKWGGTGPDSFDCSGLIVWSAQQAGVKLPSGTRTASQLHKYIKDSGNLKTDITQCKKGEVLFWSDDGYETSGVYHTGFVYSDGATQVLHAPQTGDVVKISNMYNEDKFGGCGPLTGE